MAQQLTITEAMSRALALAKLGKKTGENPRVGCVILNQDGRKIAEGYHRGAGTDHAEVDALAQLAPGEAVGATAVVTLEPCRHHGKTGPCTLALIEAGITQVVYAIADPGKDSGGGAAALTAAGITTHSGVLADQATALNHEWLVAIEQHRPHVTLKLATSLDGRAKAPDGSSMWITGESARDDAHHRRSTVDAVIVGTGTALADDPALTARRDDGTLYPEQPIPVVIGATELPKHSRIFHGPRQPILYRDHAPAAALADLFDRGVRSVIVEGGPKLASAFVAEDLVDRVTAYLAPKLIGGDGTALNHIGVYTLADAKPLRIVETTLLGNDMLVVAETRSGRVPHRATAQSAGCSPAVNSVLTESR